MLLRIGLLTRLVQKLIIFREELIAGSRRVKGQINCGHGESKGGIIENAQIGLLRRHNFSISYNTLADIQVFPMWKGSRGAMGAMSTSTVRPVPVCDTLASQ